MSIKQVKIQKLNQELMKVAGQGNLEAVKKLVRRGADIYLGVKHYTRSDRQ